MNDRIRCSICGAVIPTNEAYTVGEDRICGACAAEHTVTCENCGERIYNDLNSGDSQTPLCSRCYDRYYVTCDHCGRVLLETDSYYDNDDIFCYSCFVQHRRRVIHDYYYKPEPIFYGEGNRYMGVELEIDEGGENDSKAEKILAVANRDGNELMYIKRDGSLRNGMEIVSFPMSLKYHCTQAPWGDVMKKAKELDFVFPPGGYLWFTYSHR